MSNKKYQVSESGARLFCCSCIQTGDSVSPHHVPYQPCFTPNQVSYQFCSRPTWMTRPVESIEAQLWPWSLSCDLSLFQGAWVLHSDCPRLGGRGGPLPWASRVPRRSRRSKGPRWSQTHARCLSGSLLLFGELET